MAGLFTSIILLKLIIGIYNDTCIPIYYNSIGSNSPSDISNIFNIYPSTCTNIEVILLDYIILLAYYNLRNRYCHLIFLLVE